MRKALVILISIIIISSIGYIIYTTTSAQMKEKQTSIDEVITTLEPEPTPPGSQRTIDSGRHALMIYDESPHRLSVREWWYFNVFFNDPESDLQNWSMIVTFNKMAPFDLRFVNRDNLFIILYDTTGNNYKFNIVDKKRGTLKAQGPGVNVNFEKSWAKGEYPRWFVHAESEDGDFIAELDFISDFLPVWVEGRSSNLLIGGYVSGDYYIPRCKVEGEIIWEGNKYEVSGIGYHDHVWETFIPRFITRGWDWFNLHFDNGWEMYISRFRLRGILGTYAGALITSPNNRNLVEWAKFKFTLEESDRPQELPFILYPKKIHIEAKRGDMVLDLNIYIYNTCEIIFKRARIGMFEGPCYATGTFSWSGHTVELNGYGMSEFTRVQYLLQLPRLFRK